MITEIDASLLEKIADLTGKPVGAFNIRKDMRLRGPSVHGAYRHRPPCRRQARYRHPLQRGYQGRDLPHPRHHQPDGHERHGV